MSFLASDEHGNSVELEELATVTHPKSEAQYLFYTDFHATSDGRTPIYVSELLEEAHTQSFRLGAVRHPDDWEYLEHILQLLLEVSNLEDDED